MIPRLRVLLLLLATATAANADPWLAPGNEGLRHDILLLADAGVLRGPVTTWPISWPDVARDVLAANGSDLPAAIQPSLLRVQRLAREASRSGFSGIGLRASGSHEPAMLRGFADAPREEGELSARASWLSDRFAMNLQGTLAADPADGENLRPDGSYLGVNIANFMISAGYMERWWGPGWDGSLILSTNARPVPSLTLERNYTDPFKSRWLSWIGPWRASIAVGESTDDEVPLRHWRFLAARVNFKPRPWLEAGLTRTAQWCGGDRPCDIDTFVNMLIGRDNQLDGNNASLEQPGNQMAGYDLRLTSPWRQLPVAAYLQWIGEDEAGGLPSKFLGQFGIESWWSSSLGSARLRAEFSDTACSFTRELPEYNCGYRNSIYPQGYTHWGRVIGHSLDNDSRMYSLGAILVRPKGDVLSLTLRHAEINRDGGGNHAISAAPLDVDNVELRYSREFGFGRVSLGVGYDDRSSVSVDDSTVRGFLSWQQGF
jgi:hypothetical protein